MLTSRIPRLPTTENIDLDAGDRFDRGGEETRIAKKLPILQEEPHYSRRKQFLQCPGPREPSALRQIGVERCGRTFVVRHVRSISVAHFGILVQGEHGVDRFRQLVIIPLVDAAGICPKKVETVFPRL
jgi:hypothetical protein